MKTCRDCIHDDVCLHEILPTDIHPSYIDFSDKDDVDESCQDFKDKDKFIELPCSIYIFPHIDNPIKVTFEGDVSVVDSGDMSITISRTATLSDLAEMFDMSVEELKNTQFDNL